MSELTVAQKDKLAADLRVVISDAEEVLRVTAGQAGDQIAVLRSRMQKRLEQAKANLKDMQEVVVARAKAAGHAADEYVHKSPWQAIGAAAGIGLVVGLLIGRR